ncbi:PadR family transcriptional regulator [Lysinimonas soli]|uniref:PadR family transcriptional regulator n=1 Tax=Lysinimonas soli TaxID=1074233 RepID=A0ABW0NQC9_9MICO
MTPPVFAHGHLRLYLLSLLSERSMHGYELIQALSERFGGTYVPSAGTIYPRLAKLEEDGLVTKQSDGRKTVYEITAAGRAELAARGHELDGIELELGDSVRRLADEVRLSVNDAMKTLRADLAAATRDARGEGTAGRDDPRVAARMSLRDAEAAINDFRQQLRSDLRAEVSLGRLDPAIVELITRRLTELRREVTAALRG